MDNQDEIFQEVMLPHRHGEEQDGEHVMHNGNGNMANQQELDPGDTSLKRPPILLQKDGNVDDGELERELQELHLQDDGERNDIMHNGNGNLPNQQQLDPVHICLERPPIILQKDGNINDDKDGDPNGHLRRQFQEQFRGQGDDNGHNVTNQTHQQDEHVTPVRYFDIWNYHYPFPQAIQDGQHVAHLGPLVSTITRISQWQPSFVVAMRNGPGPYYAAIFVSMIPDLHLCNNFGDFIIRLQECFTAVIGEDVQNPTDQGLIPGYRMNYFLLEPREKVLGFEAIPWEEFKFRLALVGAWEL